MRLTASLHPQELRHKRQDTWRAARQVVGCMRWLGGPPLAPGLPFKTRFTHYGAAVGKWSPQAGCVYNLQAN